MNLRDISFFAGVTSGCSLGFAISYIITGNILLIGGWAVSMAIWIPLIIKIKKGCCNEL